MPTTMPDDVRRYAFSDLVTEGATPGTLRCADTMEPGEWAALDIDAGRLTVWRDGEILHATPVVTSSFPR